MKKKFDNYLGVPRPRKVKHVKIFLHDNPFRLEDQINEFADDHLDYKILGVKISHYDDPDGINDLMAVVTYLENASSGVGYGDYYDADEERDFD